MKFYTNWLIKTFILISNTTYFSSLSKEVECDLHQQSLHSDHLCASGHVNCWCVCISIGISCCILIMENKESEIRKRVTVNFVLTWEQRDGGEDSIKLEKKYWQKKRSFNFIPKFSDWTKLQDVLEKMWTLTWEKGIK